MIKTYGVYKGLWKIFELTSFCYFMVKVEDFQQWFCKQIVFYLLDEDYVLGLISM